MVGTLAPSLRGATADVSRFAHPTRVRFDLSLRDAFDEEIEHRFRSALDLAFRDAPARKMSVDVHAGESVDQRAAGDLHLLQVRAAELASREGVIEQSPGERDQLVIVARQRFTAVMVE